MSHPVPSSPTVSIGLPVFNGEAFLADAIRSLLAQTCADIELIIADNASTDRTGDICKAFAAGDSRIRYIRQEHNIGAAPNFKAALDAATGAYFMWAAHDDLWDADFVADAVDLLADPGVDYVFPTFRVQSIYWRTGKRFDPEIFRFVESRDRRHRVLSFASLHYLSHSANIVYSVFRREFLENAWNIQDISNDGVFGAVVVGRGVGAVGRSLFRKRYATVWPGQMQVAINLLIGKLHGADVFGRTNEAIAVARNALQRIFPEYHQEIGEIFGHYKPYSYGRHYRICPVPEGRR